MNRCRSRLCQVLLVLLVLLPAPARSGIVFATTSERDEARAAVAYAVEETRARIAALTADLADPKVLLFAVDGRIIRIPERRIDEVIAYVRLQYLVDPAGFDRAIALVASLTGVPPDLMREVLGNPQGLASLVALDLARERLRARAGWDRSAVEGHLADLETLLADALEVQAAAEAALAERDAAPCPRFAGAPLDTGSGVFIALQGDGRTYHPYPGEGFLCGYGTIHTSEFTGEHLAPDGNGYRGYWLDDAGKVSAIVTYSFEGEETDARGVRWKTGTWLNPGNGQSGWFRATEFP